MKHDDIGVKFEYDSKGRIVSISYPSNSDNIRSFKYDDLGRVILDINGCYETSFEYDDANRITRVQTIRNRYYNNTNLPEVISVQSFLYNGNNDVISSYTMDDSHYETWHNYDQCGRTIYEKCITDDGDVQEETYEYDDKNNIIYSEVRNDNLHQEKWFRYDECGKQHLVKQTNYYE